MADPNIRSLAQFPVKRKRFHRKILNYFKN